jgi:cytochrome c oxidase subunit 4
MSVHHVEQKLTYYLVFLALVVGTVLTVAAAYVDLGPLNIVIALAIAGTKATLVVLFFMHVRYSSPLTQLTVAVGFLWLVIMLVLLMSDYFSRNWLSAPKSW